MTDAITQDSRGILDPGRMRQRVDFVRYEPPPEMVGLVQWFWAVAWHLDDGEEFTQPVLSHPCANLSVGPRSSRGLDDDTVEATVVGVATRVDHRRLRGRGWNVAAKLEPGTFGAFLDVDAATLTDRIRPMRAVLPVDEAELVGAMVAAPDDRARASLLGEVLATTLRRADPVRVAAARECGRVAARIQQDRSVRSVTDLADAVGTSPRSLQRMFRQHAGVTPLWMIRRYRLIDAAEAARAGSPTSWGDLAAELGYADQAHLSREFSATIGMSPTRYATSVTALSPSSPPCAS
ncbi:AraC family transcriptional regulator [Arachnia propionica]|uniref:AraC family transcriptional regulator n=1 Tax=Arachnia propionica TaxID=1750 RepID=A0A3P1WRV4_9ACTN|nr:helix-turn-helix transcriptional regulator [Arachnia propionica]RRD48696.1 AraC family transcriptional regulator [Arachnia propionica]